MQTFLPYRSFERTAEALDYRRLGKQRIEAKQILMALDGESKGWVNHPATLMWSDNRDALVLYAVVITEEWISRGYNDAQLPWFKRRLPRKHAIELPAWLGKRKFHASHRSNLLRKDPLYYRRFGWQESDDLPYVWPR